MKISYINSIDFGYYSPLKDEFKRGNIPLKKDFYGADITKENVTLDHVRPRSKKGKDHISNYVLATEQKNNLRGNRDIFLYTNEENVKQYFEVFENCDIGNIKGTDYLKMISKTLRGLWDKNKDMWEVLNKWK